MPYRAMNAAVCPRLARCSGPLPEARLTQAHTEDLGERSRVFDMQHAHVVALEFDHVNADCV